MKPPTRSKGIVRAPVIDVALAPTSGAAPPFVSTPAEQSRMEETVEGSRPLNSRIAYEGDIAHFRAWCEARPCCYFPASVEAVAYYLNEMAYGEAPRADHKGRQPRGAGGRWSLATIQRRSGSIGKMHRMAALHDPTSDARVKELLLSIRRRIGKAQRQARPLLPEHLRAAFAAMLVPRSVLDTRDTSVATLTFALAGRRSEVCELDLADIEFTSDGLMVNIGPSESRPERRTKTNQEGAREILNVPTGDDPATDPVTALRAWLDVRGNESGPLFFGVTRQGKIRRKRMPAQRVSFIAKRLAKLAGLDPKHYSGHSLRAGFVTAADANGVSSGAIMRQTRHKLTDTLRRYVRPEGGFKDHPGKGLL